jgi:hypothetical protein
MNERNRDRKMPKEAYTTDCFSRLDGLYAPEVMNVGKPQLAGRQGVSVSSVYAAYTDGISAARSCIIWVGTTPS